MKPRVTDAEADRRRAFARELKSLVVHCGLTQGKLIGSLLGERDDHLAIGMLASPQKWSNAINSEENGEQPLDTPSREEILRLLQYMRSNRDRDFERAHERINRARIDDLLASAGKTRPTLDEVALYFPDLGLPAAFARIKELYLADLDRQLGIVRADDAGLHLREKHGRSRGRLAILTAWPGDNADVEVAARLAREVRQWDVDEVVYLVDARRLKTDRTLEDIIADEILHRAGVALRDMHKELLAWIVLELASARTSVFVFGFHVREDVEFAGRICAEALAKPGPGSIRVMLPQESYDRIRGTGVWLGDEFAVTRRPLRSTVLDDYNDRFWTASPSFGPRDDAWSAADLLWASLYDGASPLDFFGAVGPIRYMPRRIESIGRRRVGRRPLAAALTFESATQEHVSNTLLVGDGGCGKTTELLALHYALSAERTPDWLAEFATAIPSGYVPFYVNFPNYARRLSQRGPSAGGADPFVSYVVEQIQARSETLAAWDREHVRRSLLSTTALLFLIDGLDEAIVENPAGADRALGSVFDELRTRSRGWAFVLAGRDTDHSSSGKLRNVVAACAQLQDLGSPEAREYLLGVAEDRGRAWDLINQVGLGTTSALGTSVQAMLVYQLGTLLSGEDWRLDAAAARRELLQDAGATEIPAEAPDSLPTELVYTVAIHRWFKGRTPMLATEAGRRKSRLLLKQLASRMVDSKRFEVPVAEFGRELNDHDAARNLLLTPLISMGTSGANESTLRFIHQQYRDLFASWWLMDRVLEALTTRSHFATSNESRGVDSAAGEDLPTRNAAGPLLAAKHCFLDENWRPILALCARQLPPTGRNLLLRHAVELARTDSSRPAGVDGRVAAKAVTAVAGELGPYEMDDDLKPLLKRKAGRARLR